LRIENIFTVQRNFFKRLLILNGEQLVGCNLFYGDFIFAHLK